MEDQNQRLEQASSSVDVDSDKGQETPDPVATCVESDVSIIEATASVHIREKKNPLFVEPILETIFGFLLDRDLRNCRLVCQLWNREALRKLRTKHKESLTSKKQALKLLRLMKSRPKYKVSHLCLEDFDLDFPQFEELMDLITPTLYSLKMFKCIMDNIDFIHAVIRKSPLLEKLSLDTLKSKHGLYHTLFPVYGEDGILGEKVVLPKVRGLEYMSYEVPEDTSLTSVIETFPNLENLVAKNLKIGPPATYKKLRLPKLKKLQLQMGMTPIPGLFDDHLAAFMNLKLTGLEGLCFQNVEPDINTELWRSFIESQAGTLIKLSMQQLEMEPGRPVSESMSPLPLNLPKLKKITLDKPFIKNINHLSGLGNLESLEFTFTGVANWSRILPKKINAPPKVHDLIVVGIDAKFFAVLSNAFGNLRSLRVNQCDDEILLIIFRDLAQLTSIMCLDDGKKHMSDTGITGIPKNVLQTTGTGIGKDDGDLAAFRTQRYLGDMKNLELLLFHFRKPPTEKIYWHGISHIVDNLKTLMVIGLKLSAAAIKDISKSGMRNLPLSTSDLIEQGLLVADDVHLPRYNFMDTSDMFFWK